MCVALGSSVPSKERMRYIKNKNQGGVRYIKAEGSLVSTFRGVLFNLESEVLYLEHTSRDNLKLQKTVININTYHFFLYNQRFDSKNLDKNLPLACS